MKQQKLLQVIESISNLNGNSFYNSLCLALSKAINASFVSIATIDHDKQLASTISFVAHHQVIDNITYSLEGTPCDNVSCGKVSVYVDGIQEAFPEDKFLVDMKLRGYIGVPLLDPEGNVTALFVATYEDVISNEKEVLSFFLLFKGLLEKELEKDAYVEKLRFSETIIEESHEAIFICNERIEITSCNTALLKLTGYERLEIYGKTPRIFSSHQHSKEFYEQMWHKIKSENKWSGEITNKKKSGEIYTQHLSISLIKNNLGEKCYVAFIWDITEHKKAQEKIYYQANHDTLTELTNRFYFTEKLVNRITNYQYNLNSSRKTSVIYFDIDNFSHINNAYGLTFGDRVLIELSKRLKHLHEQYIFSRLDGDGFGVLISYGFDEQLTEEINRIDQLLNKPLNIDGTSISCSISIGISTYQPHVSHSGHDKLLVEAKVLLRQADQAMRKAKKIQNKNVIFFDNDIENAIIQEAVLENELTLAIKNKALPVHFQPIVNLKENTVDKFECLVRWHHKEEWISPEVFIPIAEKYGLIIQLGQFVLEQACQVVNELKNKGFDNISFNVNRSIYEFSQLEEDKNNWLETIRKHQIPAHLIAFELTESVLAPENQQNLMCLRQLQASKCKISLDDFGTGYSSLSYLRRFPIDYLKIDKSFINEIYNNNEDRVLVKSIISMGHALGIKIVAEGVEDRKQLSILMELDCDYIQGYYFSKPLPKIEIISFLQNFRNTHSHY